MKLFFPGLLGQYIALNKFRPLIFFVALSPFFALSGCNTSQKISPPTHLTKATQKLDLPYRSAVHAKPRATQPISTAIFFGVKTQRKVFALTFDDGPDPKWTPQVLDILQQWHAAATFFMVGKMVRSHPLSAYLVKAANYPIGNHSWSHPRATSSPMAEVERTDAILEKTLQIKPTLFRPPYGILNNGLARAARARGENVIIWNALGADWDKNATAESIATKVLKGAKPGGIALLHDGGGNRSQTIAALPYIIDGLRKRGFRLLSVPELLTMGQPIHEGNSLVKKSVTGKTPHR